MKRSWQVAALLLAFLIGSALASEERELVRVELEPSDAYEGPESLAEHVRYSEPFDAGGGVRVNVHARAADVLVSLVDEHDEVREARAWVDSRETLSFGRVPEGRYRLRLVARSSDLVHAHAVSGGFSPGLLALAVLLVLVPPLSWTLRRNLR